MLEGAGICLDWTLLALSLLPHCNDFRHAAQAKHVMWCHLALEARLANIGGIGSVVTGLFVRDCCVTKVG
jgi:hypothetical protein